MPEGPNTTNLHCDADYHHPPAEVGVIIKTSNNGQWSSLQYQVNWWFPFTRVSGSNSLFIESRPGAGDFEPVTLDYGQVCDYYDKKVHKDILYSSGQINCPQMINIK